MLPYFVFFSSHFFHFFIVPANTYKGRGQESVGKHAWSVGWL